VIAENSVAIWVTADENELAAWPKSGLVTPSGRSAANFAVMHNTAQTAMMRFVEPGQGNETALQNKPRTT
jgi:hypothetical protein